MNSIIKNYSRFLDNHNIRYSFFSDNALSIQYSLEKYSNASLNILVSCTSDNGDFVDITVLGLGTVPNISNDVFKLLNNINHNKRWGRLHISNKNDIIMDLNFFVPEINTNEMIQKYVSLLIVVAEDYFPMIQKLIWTDNN